MNAYAKRDEWSLAEDDDGIDVFPTLREAKQVAEALMAKKPSSQTLRASNATVTPPDARYMVSAHAQERAPLQVAARPETAALFGEWGASLATDGTRLFACSRQGQYRIHQVRRLGHFEPRQGHGRGNPTSYHPPEDRTPVDAQKPLGGDNYTAPQYGEDR